MTSRILAIIPARGGSKGLAHKNILDLGGKPLIAWTIEAAIESRYIDRLIVSTDDPKISEVSKAAGADVPFLRPDALAEDVSTSEAVLTHAIKWLEENEAEEYDVVVYLQATDPFRGPGIIDRVVERLLADPKLDSVFAAKPEHKNYWVEQDGEFVAISHRGYQGRQTKKEILREDTGIACASRTAIIKEGRRIGDRIYIIPHSHPGDMIDIHTQFDLDLANQLIHNFKIIPNQPTKEQKL
jgi:CMP-N-acetylneuraminic acid synthetase